MIYMYKVFSPVSILKVLVLPAPFTPNNPKVSLAGIPRQRLSTAVRVFLPESYTLVRFSILTV